MFRRSQDSLEPLEQTAQHVFRFYRGIVSSIRFIKVVSHFFFTVQRKNREQIERAWKK